MSRLAVVTGAFSYTGRHVTRRLLDKGWRVRTLTNHPGRPNPFPEPVTSSPFHFDKPAALEEALRGAALLVNTYWVRFAYGRSGFDDAVRNTEILFQAARRAGVQKIVHVSIANPVDDPVLPYYRGKFRFEQALRALGLKYAIVRPTVIFSLEDILLNNIAWFVRTLPVFGIPGDGRYRLQPVHVDDMADLIVREAENPDAAEIDAVGPEICTFEELVRCVAVATGCRARLLHLPTSAAYWALKPFGWWLGDIVLTRDEIDGLMRGLLVSARPPTGKVKLSDWLDTHGKQLGLHYASEVKRHF